MKHNRSTHLLGGVFFRYIFFVCSPKIWRKLTELTKRFFPVGWIQKLAAGVSDLDVDFFLTFTSPGSRSAWQRSRS